MKLVYLLVCGLFLSEFCFGEDVVEVLAFRANSNTPVSFQNIDKQKLSEVEVSQEPSFFLSKTPSMTNYSDAGSYQGYSYLRLRGMDQTRINMTLDGIPLNEPEDQGVYFSNYSGILGALEAIQIQRGVGTSQNGTASYAGSIQLKSINLNGNQKGYVDLGIGSYNTLNSSVNYLSGLQDGKGFFVQVSKVNTEGYKYHSGNDSESIFASGIYEDPVGYWKLTGFSGKQSNQLAWLGVSEEEIKKNPRTNGNSDENDQFKQSLIYVTRHISISNQLNSITTVYYNSLKGSYDFDLNNYLGIPFTNELYNYGFNSNFVGLISNLEYKIDDFSVVSGLHVNQYSRTHTGSEKTLGSLYENTGYKNSLSGFLTANYRLNKVMFFVDMQYRKTTFEYAGNVAMDELKWSFINPRTGVTLAATDDINIYYSLGKTGREPTRTDLFGGNENLEPDQNGNPNLFIVKPEYVVDHEFGIRFKEKNYEASLNLFYMSFSHEITLNGQVGPNGLPLNQDVGASNRTGVEFLNSLNLTDQFSLEIAASVSRNTIDDKKTQFHPILTPEKTFNISLNYQKEAISCGTSLRYQSQSYLNFSNTLLLNSYSTASAYLAYVFKQTETRLQLNNLLNKRYFASGMIDVNGQPKYFVSAPFNFSASVRVNF